MSFSNFVLCVRVPITLAPEIPRCGSDRGNSDHLTGAIPPQTHLPLHTNYASCGAKIVDIGWYICR